MDLDDAFDDTPCESTSCGVLHTAALSCGGTPMGDGSIRVAVAAWLSDATAAEAAYGHISTWETGGVTDMSELFEDASSFNEDISAWDTSGVTTMVEMFQDASSFNQNIGGWSVAGARVAVLYGPRVQGPSRPHTRADRDDDNRDDAAPLLRGRPSRDLSTELAPVRH